MKENTVGIIGIDVYISDFLRELFRDEGYRTVIDSFRAVSDNPDLYTRMLREYNPRLIIIDLPYPHIPNWEVVKKLKAQPGSEDVSFIILASCIRELEEVMEETEKSQLMGRPFQLEDVFAKAQKLMETGDESSVA